MRLRARTQIHLSTPQPSAIIAMLRPQSGAGQWIVSEAYDLKPLVHPVEYTDVFGNLCQRFVMPKGDLEIRVECVVECSDAIATAPGAPLTPAEELRCPVVARRRQSDERTGRAVEARADSAATLSSDDISLSGPKTIVRCGQHTAHTAGPSWVARRRRSAGLPWSSLGSDSA